MERLSGACSTKTGSSIFPPVGVKSDSLTTNERTNEQRTNVRTQKATERYSVWVVEGTTGLRTGKGPHLTGSRTNARRPSCFHCT